MSKPPAFLLSTPEPQIRQRLYNGRKLVVWDGKVKTSSVVGWVENPRIMLARKSMQDQIGQRELNQDEVFELMKTDPEIRLKELRDDILKNGLREPLTLAFNGKLLDGNRRFFALRYALEGLPASDPNRQDLEAVEAFVLTKDASSEDEHNVLVEENFSASLKLEWPEYVKAEAISKAKDEGYNLDEISSMFSWKKAKIRETLKIIELIEDFKTFATSPIDPSDESGGGLGLTEIQAETLAARNYQYFNEAQKSFHDPLKTDFDFKTQFFRWIKEGKFASFQEVRIAWRAWQHPEARAAIVQSEPTAAKAAKAIIDYSTRVVKDTGEAVGRIDGFVKFMRGMTIDQLSCIPQPTIDSLSEVLALVSNARNGGPASK